MSHVMCCTGSIRKSYELGLAFLFFLTPRSEITGFAISHALGVLGIGLYSDLDDACVGANERARILRRLDKPQHSSVA